MNKTEGTVLSKVNSFVSAQVNSLLAEGFSDFHRKTLKTMTEDTEKTTESDNLGLSKVKSQVPDPTNRGQTSQEECCCKGNNSA